MQLTMQLKTFHYNLELYQGHLILLKHFYQITPVDSIRLYFYIQDVRKVTHHRENLILFLSFNLVKEYMLNVPYVRQI
ncbi:hypothetical protein C0J52_07200 [Blattella germanica]|nr:hypothetical protein C0J52_07200 [Blattella germanica]